jgi:hypothetical protein
MDTFAQEAVAAVHQPVGAVVGADGRGEGSQDGEDEGGSLHVVRALNGRCKVFSRS